MIQVEEEARQYLQDILTKAGRDAKYIRVFFNGIG